MLLGLQSRPNMFSFHPRPKSAIPYRALGSRTPACLSHRSLEQNYNVLRSWVNASVEQQLQNSHLQQRQQQQQQQQYYQKQQLQQQPPFCSNAFTTEANAMSNQVGVSSRPTFSTVDDLTNHMSDLHGARRQSAPTMRTKRAIDIDDLINERNNPELLLPRKTQPVTPPPSPRPTSATKNANCQWADYRSPRRNRKVIFSFQSRKVGDKTNVLPLTPSSQSRLSVLGDGHFFKSTDPMKTPALSPRAPRKGILVNRAESRGIDKGENTPRDSPQQNVRGRPGEDSPRGITFSRESHEGNSTGNSTLPTLSPMAFQIDATKTPYRLKLGEDNRPKTSPGSCESTPRESKTAEPKRKPTPRTVTPASASNDNDSATGRFRSTTTKRAPKRTQPKTNSGEATDSSPKDGAWSNAGIEGKTEMSKATTGALTLSVFLPREVDANSYRVCHRASGAAGNMRQDDDRDTSEEDFSKPIGDFDDIHGANDRDTKDSTASDTYPVSSTTNSTITCSRVDTVSSKIHACGHQVRTQSPVGTMRALHCELFGPDLCGDCQLQYQRADVHYWQNSLYPDIKVNTDLSRRALVTPVPGPHIGKSSFRSFSPGALDIVR